MDGCGVAPGMEERDAEPDFGIRPGADLGVQGAGTPGEISSSHMFWDDDPVILISCVT